MASCPNPTTSASPGTTPQRSSSPTLFLTSLTPSGSSSEEENEGRCMLKCTSSSPSHSPTSKSKSDSLGIPLTWTRGAAHPSKHATIVPKPTHALPAPGLSVNNVYAGKVRAPTSRDSLALQASLSKAGRWHSSAPKIQPRTLVTLEDSPPSSPNSPPPSGETSESHSFAAPPAPASRRSSTKPSDMTMCTLAQMKNFAGLTGTKLNAAYYLTTLLWRMKGKHSYAYWMAILSACQSSTIMSSLVTLSSVSVPTTGRATAGQNPFAAESTADSGSEDNEGVILSSSPGSEMEDNRLEEDMSDHREDYSESSDEEPVNKRSKRRY